MIHLSNVWYGYTGISDSNDVDWILKDINVSIHSGEYVAIIGVNGSGKSTLARLFNALHLPIKGRVYIFGLDTSDQSNLYTIRQKVGLIFQNPDSQIIGNTVFEDIAFGLQNLGLSLNEISKRVTNVLDIIGLKGEEYVRHLSGGERQRLVMAGVLAMDPDILIIDEGVCMLDPADRYKFLNIISDLHKLGKTIVHITHTAELYFQADRIIVLTEGSISQDNTTNVFFSEPNLLRQQGFEVPYSAILYKNLTMAGVLRGPKVLKNTDELVTQICKLM